jgi:hypothetical protein
MTAEPERVHVMPEHDSAPHRAATDCWCGPTPEPDEPRVWVHHSADGREITT